MSPIPKSQSFREGRAGKQQVFWTKMAELPKDIGSYGGLGLLLLSGLRLSQLAIS